MLIEIKHRWTGQILYSGDHEDLPAALWTAWEKGLSLRDADLTGAVLRGADLRDADLTGADLTGAVLRGADLRDADLTGADLTGAVLRDADLTGAVLRGADLRGAVLTGAVLRDADLTGAVLRGADLRGADLTGAVLREQRADLFDVLISAPHEVPALREALLAGKIDGSTYSGECCCLVGTIARARGCSAYSLPELKPDASRPAEQWFTNIRPGDTPENSSVARITLEWIDRFLAVTGQEVPVG
jgi:hypothetical protein